MFIKSHQVRKIQIVCSIFQGFIHTQINSSKKKSACKPSLVGRALINYGFNWGSGIKAIKEEEDSLAYHEALFFLN